MPLSFPRTYSVSRGGRVVEVTVVDRDGLRVFRTELELLRRVDRMTQPGRLSDVALSEEKYTSEDRRELAEILGDARSVRVQACVAIVDQEFDDLRKELLMSVVNEQAEKLAHEMVESGVAFDAVGEAPPTVEQALDVAEAELAKIAALTGTGPTTDAEVPESATVVTPVVEPKPTPVEAAIEEVAVPLVIRVPATVPQEAQSVGEAFSPERAEQVVAEIETGIRKLASILSSEVNEQWKKAEVAFHEVVGLRGRTEQAFQSTSSMLAQIAHLKEEMEIARDDAEVARREAKLLRDDARRAKERAEAAAAACVTASAGR